MKPSLPVLLGLVALLSACRNPRGTEDWIRDLGAADAATRAAAATSLGQLGSTAAVGPLAAALRDPAPEVRAAAAGALGDLGAGAAPAAADLVAASTDASTGVRDAARRALRAVGAPGLEGILPILASEDEGLRRAAAVALQDLGADAAPAVPDLIAALRFPDEKAAFEVIKALAAVGRPAVGALIAALKEPNASVRGYGALALGLLREWITDPAVFALAAALSDDEDEVRLCAAAALGSLGPRAREAAPALEALVGDGAGPESVRLEARAALEKVMGRD